MAKKTRIMKVTMDEEEFRKFDLGITHSDNGIRTAYGRLSTLPDIAPCDTDEDKKYSLSEDSPWHSYEIKESSGQSEEKSDFDKGIEAAQGIIQCVRDVVRFLNNHPEVVQGMKTFGEMAKSSFSYGYSWLSSRIKMISSKQRNGESNTETGTEKAPESNDDDVEIVPEFDIQHENRQTFQLSKEDAERLLANMRNRAAQLAILMYVWGNLSIKDEKTNEEYKIEQNCIIQLLNDDARKTIQTLVSNRQLLDESTAKTLSDYLDGYLNSEKGLVPIPVKTIHQAETEHRYF